MMELTELHCTFQTDSLSHLAQVTYWHTTQSESNKGSVPGSIHNWTVHNSTLLTRTDSISALTHNSGTRLNEAPPLKDTPEETPISAPKPVKRTDLGPDDSVSTSTADTEPLRAPLPTGSPLTAANLEQHTRKEEHIPVLQPINLKHGLHLAEDIALTLATAQNLRKMKRTHMTLEDLRHSIETELETKHKLGKSYIPFNATNLDHPVALTRELIARHSDDQIHCWTRNAPAPKLHARGCLLNYTRSNPFSPNYTENKRLDNYLLLFAKNALDLLLQNKKDQKQFTTAIKFLLAERKMESSFEWLQKAPLEKLFIDDEPLLNTERAKFTIKTHKPEKSDIVLKETAPPVNKKTRELLNTQLHRVITNTLATEESTLSELPPDHKTIEIITKLIDYIVAHNPRWTSPLFNVSTHMTKQALSHSHLVLPTLEILLMTHGLTEILRTLRPK